MYLFKGTPPSLAKDQRRREAVAMVPVADAVKRKRIKHVMAVAAALLFVACAKISMKGNPVGVSNAAVVPPRQNKSAIKSANPRTPLSIMVEIIAQGTIVEAFWTSSATLENLRVSIIRHKWKITKLSYDPREVGVFLEGKSCPVVLKTQFGKG